MSVQLALLFLLGAAMFLGLVALTIASAGAALIWVMATRVYRHGSRAKPATRSGQSRRTPVNGGHARIKGGD